MDTESERSCVEIRIRAERHAGQLLRAMERTPRKESGRAGGKAPATVAGASDYRRTIDRAGIKERTARRWQELADVPTERFEAHLKADETPSSRAPTTRTGT